MHQDLIQIVFVSAMNAIAENYLKVSRGGVEMGLFDRIAKGLVSEAIGSIIQNVTGETNQTVKQDGNRQSQSDYFQAEPIEKKDIRPYFAEILASEFGQFQVRENVSLSEFGAEGRPYDFCLYQNGVLVAVIVLAERNRTRNHPYWNSEKAARAMNVPFVHFYTHMPNERGFVIGRINRLMNRG